MHVHDCPVAIDKAVALQPVALAVGIEGIERRGDSQVVAGPVGREGPALAGVVGIPPRTVQRAGDAGPADPRGRHVCLLHHVGTA